MTSEEKKSLLFKGCGHWQVNHGSIGYKTKQAEKDRELGRGWGGGEWGIDLEGMGHGYDRNTLYNFM